MRHAEARGLTHWILFTDSESKAIYAYNVVNGFGKATAVLQIDASASVTALAVDANLGYLFVASEVTKEGDYESTDVHRYNFTVDATTKPSATLTVN